MRPLPRLVGGLVAILLCARTAPARTTAFAYVANAFDGTISVVDTAANAVTKTIALASIPADVALNPAGNRLYVAAVAPGRIMVVDATTKRIGPSVALGDDPNVMAMSPDGRRLFVTVARRGGDTLVAVDLATLTVAGEVPVGQDVSAIAVDPLGARVYLTDYASGAVVVVDAATLAPQPPLTAGPMPLAIAVHPSGTPLYVAHRDAIAVLDPATGAALGEVAVGGAFALALDPGGARLFAGAGLLLVVDTAKRKVRAMVGLPPPAADVAFDVAVHPNGSRVYAAGSLFDSDDRASLWVVDATEASYLTAVTVGLGAETIALGPESTCGNAVVEATEQCDDANDVAGDGCEVVCQRTGDPSLLPACLTVADCQQAIDALLPDAAGLEGRRARHAARRMRRLDRTADAALRDQHDAAARHALRKLLAVARRLDARDPAAIELPALQGAVRGLLTLIRR